MEVEQFNYELPEALIAQTPLTNRTHSRLLALNKATGNIAHLQFEQLIEFLEPRDLLVLNDTKVIPARLFGYKPETGAKAEILLLKALGNDRWETLIKPGKKFKQGARIHFGTDNGQPLLSAVIEAEGDMGGRTLRFTYDGIFPEILDQLGQMPLPPYIKEQLPQSEKERYQTVYARHEGSAAAPTAGLHFNEQYLQQLQDKGITLAFVTLHVGLGTFRPVSVDKIEQHQMHEEYYDLSAETAELINRTRAKGGRIIAVGTTSARTLETAARVSAQDPALAAGEIKPCRGWTTIFIYPGVGLQIVDGLLTNFHLPKSTLLMLISALAGREKVLNAYQEAVAQEYRFFSFGDAMLIY